MNIRPGHLIPLLLLGSVTPSSLSADLHAENTISVYPTEVVLSGQRAFQGLLVSQTAADGATRDLTREVRYRSLNEDVCSVDADGQISARGDGRGVVEIMAGPQSLRVPVTVRQTKQTEVCYFATDIIPILSRHGCNSSACHGKAEGQNGFQLSVFGFDEVADYAALVREGRGRRIFPAAPDQSLLLAKASGTVPHRGGVRLAVDSKEYQLILQWIRAGARFDRQHPRVVALEVFPKERILSFQSRQQLSVTAVFDDDSRRDVTQLARFRSNNEALAVVDESGLVNVGTTPGHVAIMAGFLHHMETLQLLIPNPHSGRSPSEQLLSDADFIDQLVNRRLEQLNITPSGQADDATFLRRVYFDIIGTLPTAAEARRFLDDDTEHKRAALVDHLLSRPEYAVYWALKWSDMLRVDRAILGHRRAYAYYRWIRDHLRANRRMDEFARAVATAVGPLDESPQGGFYQAVVEPGDRASSFTQAFLGIRIECAECHHHPFDRWSQQDYYGMTAFFEGVKTRSAPPGDELVLDTSLKTVHPRTGDVVEARPLGASTSALPVGNDSRQRLADWLTSHDNPWFARNLANRMWAHLLGSGLVEPVDDVRQTNPSSNHELLTELASYLQSKDFDIKALIRVITRSRAYQRATHTNSSNASDIQNASRTLLKPLDAEVLLDAVSQTTGIPSRFNGAAPGTRAIELWDSKLQHPFLRLFGRPERRTACECERASEPSVSQVLHIMNSPEIYARLDHQGGTVSKLEREIPSDSLLAEQIYLTFLSRYPSDTEREIVNRYFDSHAASRRDAAVDLAWSLMNTLEFSFNH